MIRINNFHKYSEEEEENEKQKSNIANLERNVEWVEISRQKEGGISRKN